MSRRSDTARRLLNRPVAVSYRLRYASGTIGLFRRNPEDCAHTMLRFVLPDMYRVSYFPAFPRPDRTTFSFFQVVFAVGPAEDAAVRSQVHCLFEQVLATISRTKVVRQADVVSLRARRRVPEDPLCRPEHPLMFIEAWWPGAAVKDMHAKRSFSTWADTCAGYINRFDKRDCLNRLGGTEGPTHHDC